MLFGLTLSVSAIVINTVTLQGVSTPQPPSRANCRAQHSLANACNMNKKHSATSKNTSTQVMAYFNPAKQTEVLVDGSPVGVGAILAQEGKIIAYSSRALTDVEQRYSQTDREMLAVVFGVEHFHLYLYGSNFTVCTDHEPLLGIYKSQKSATTRTERWRLRLSPYDMTLKYRPG